MMKTELKKITIRELTKGYEDKGHDGVFGFDGKLDIRPPYQREFVYDDKKRDAVIDTIMKNLPLNVMYWAVRDDGTFEVIDGQQRTISIAQYANSDFAFNDRYFHNLQDDEQEQILNYELMVYHCTGTDSERLDWFKTINIAGEKLTDQELRNAVYSGPWVTDAKRYFSKNGCAAFGLGSRYLNGSPIRQEYLETAIKWLNNGEIELYMAKHQLDADALKLWEYFESVIDWVEKTFTNYRTEMKGLDWGGLYNKFKDTKLDSAKLETEVAKLMEDEDVSNKRGIYFYVLTGEEKHLNIRLFDDKQKREAYERQGGICPLCNKKFNKGKMEADHITPWHLGGKTDSDNCQMLCKDCNRTKGGK